MSFFPGRSLLRPVQPDLAEVALVTSFGTDNILNRVSPDGSPSDVNIRAFLDLPARQSEVWTATVTLGSTNDGRGVDLAVFAGLVTYSSRRLLWDE
jgi:hypothetical protein